MNAINTTTAGSLLALHHQDVERLARYAGLVLLAGLLPAFLWLLFAPLSSAVVAPAYVKVDLNRRTVQHAEGGIVQEVMVRDGQSVRRGETLMILGDVGIAADDNRLSYRVAAERLSIARLDAEQSLANKLVFGDDIQAAAAADVRVNEQMNKEHALFKAHREAMLSQSSLLRLKREKVQQEIGALRAQISQAGLSLQHQRADLESNRNLLRSGFIAQTRINHMEASVADYGVKLEEKRTDLARAEQRIIEIDIKLRSMENDFRQKASDQLKVAAARLSEIEQEQRKSADAAIRQTIVSPADGEVIGLRFTAPGAVIAPREAIADIVPNNPRLVIEARIRTEDISRIRKDQAADIRFTAFKYRTTKLVQGRVSYVSGDRLTDQAANAVYYSILIEVDPASLASSGEIQLQAGMPAEVYVKGEDRTPLQYLAEPVTQILRRAGREL